MPHRTKDKIPNDRRIDFFASLAWECKSQAAELARQFDEEDSKLCPDVTEDDYLAAICPTVNYFLFWFNKHIRTHYSRLNRDKFGRCDCCYIMSMGTKSVCLLFDSHNYTTLSVFFQLNRLLSQPNLAEDEKKHLNRQLFAIQMLYRTHLLLDVAIPRKQEMYMEKLAKLRPLECLIMCMSRC